MIKNIFISIYLCISLFIFPNIIFADNITARPKFEIQISENIFNNPPFMQCHASTLIELNDNSIMAAWFGGSYERCPDVCIWGSIRNSNGWSKPIKLADGIINDTLRYACWNPVLFKNKKNEIILFYKIGPSPSEWWGMYKISKDDGKTWGQAVKLPPGILGPIKNKPIYTETGRIISPSSVENGDLWRAHIELSDDDGLTWSLSKIKSSDSVKLIQPSILKLNDGSYLSLMRSNQNYVMISKSTDDGGTWSKPEKSKVQNPNSGIDAVTLNNGLYMLIYNPAYSGKEWFEGRSKLNAALSTNGEDWEDIIKLEDKETGEYSYPAIIQAKDGTIHITYTSDRKNIRYIVLSIP